MSNEQGISRRNLVKMGGIGAIGALGALALGGCATGSASGAGGAGGGADALAAPLSDEERLASISDPIYMGGKTNASGQALEMGTGKQGQIANQAMIDKREEYNSQLHKVTDRVYCAVGNGLANSTMIIGDTGIIIVDTNESMEAAPLDRDRFRTVTDKPVAPVIY